MFVTQKSLDDLSRRLHRAGKNGIDRERVLNHWLEQRGLRYVLTWGWYDFKRFIVGCKRGRPLRCHACGERLMVGDWIQRVKVPALPWEMWRHRDGVGCR